MVTSLILLIGCFCQAKIAILRKFCRCSFCYLKGLVEQCAFQGGKSTIASILWKLPGCTTHTHHHHPLPSLESFHVPQVEKTFPLVFFNTSKILMTFGHSSILYLVFTWLQEEQGSSGGYWILAFLMPAYSFGEMWIEWYTWEKFSLLSYSHHCLII